MLSRRSFLEMTSFVVSAGATGQTEILYGEQERIGMTFGENYPAYPHELAREIVTVSHFDLGRVRELVSARPQLVCAGWDWGFGDWETPLGAASHMGRRDIAEYLLSEGAPPSLFSATMLGDLATVKQVLSSNRGRVPSGPHSISLLAHARMGGKAATDVLAYLEALGNADMAPPVPLAAQDQTRLAGNYKFGVGDSQHITVDGDLRAYANSPMYTHGPQLNWTRKGTMGRPLFHLGDCTFHPAGAPSVRIQFEQLGKQTTMTVRDGGETLRATRDEQA